MNWKTLTSTYLFKDDWLTVRADKCEKPDGKIIDPYYVYEFPDWVTAVAVTSDDEIILVRQYRQALGETLIEIPGGCVDPSDENLQAAAARELLEETGYAFESYTYLGKLQPIHPPIIISCTCSCYRWPKNKRTNAGRRRRY